MGPPAPLHDGEVLRRFTPLDDELAVGSHPHAPEHALLLTEEHGIRALVCLQSDEDLSDRGLQWSLLWQMWLRSGVKVSRIPIIEFDKKDLYANLDEAVAAIARHIGRGRRTFVHCNEGLNRSPTAILAYLVAHRGLTPDEANEWLVERHDCVPYLDVLEDWASRR